MRIDMTETRRRNAPNSMPQYEDEESLLPSGHKEKEERWSAKRRRESESSEPSVLLILFTFAMIFLFLFGLVYWIVFADSGEGFPLTIPPPCDTITEGYQCIIDISHTWGQYSPYYKVESELSLAPPDECAVNFAQLLYRHGARYPTADKSARYNETITKITSGASNFTGPYAFLQNYDYDLGSDSLTALGQQELVNAGIDFFTRYEALSTSNTPFIRAGDLDRVVASARKWSEGFHKAKIASGRDKDAAYPYPILEISEDVDKNNTLHHGLCTAFEASTSGQEAQTTFGDTFLPDITGRLKADLQLPDLNNLDTLSLMDLCPFTIVAGRSFDPVARIADPSKNPFCALFTSAEWEKYDYLQSLGKYYGYGPGAPLGPTQGVGFVNELIARLTDSAVQDRTTVNHTLDSDAATFPLGKGIYADFSHDNDMTAIFSAMGLFEGVPALTKHRVMDVEEMGGYAASRSVPFAGRVVVEKLACGDGGKDEMVRFILNGRVWPFEGCGADERGLCRLERFVESLKFAREGGKWDECFDVEKPKAGAPEVATA